jgi:hypothetical protein
MDEETFLLSLPRVITPWRLLRRLAAPTALAAIATGFAVVGVLATSRPAGAAAVAWAAGAILLMRPDEERLAAGFAEANARIRRFLSRHHYLRDQASARSFFEAINPLDSETSWQALVGMTLPRGAWTALSVPALLAATALVIGATVLLVPFASAAGSLLLVIVTLLAILLGFDAYASTVRAVLSEPAPEAAAGLRRTLTVLATVDDAIAAIHASGGRLPADGESTDIA